MTDGSAKGSPAALSAGLAFDPARVPTPSYVVDAGLLRRNAEILDSVRRRTGCRILLALKGFATFAAFPHIRWALDGCCASSPHEARLAREEFGGEVHSFAAGMTEAHVREFAELSDHVVFNSFAQLDRFRPILEAAAHPPHVALRVNPEHSEGHTPIYDPCGPCSRLGIHRAEFAGRDNPMRGISGLHFHTLCQHNADALARTLAAFEERFADLIPGLSYVNFGGGHHITRPDYDLDLLCETINAFKARHGVQVYLEPGEAVALNAGFLVSEVLDVVERGMPIAILDTAVPCHMPDVIEMPYRPEIIGAGMPGEKAHTYRLGGLSCLAGDVAGDYSFDAPLRVGDRLVFCDMAIYSMVKNNTFNGVNLPAICLREPDSDSPRVVRTFGYQDFKERLS
ncbi:carboxynorspermidine decarboxylase [Desulfovibrio sp. X2]|uniref:carboxynorspermidine decarboxylase n=1 Tax=Desulfovibrio sp. X2 TaxID=941449 RepID=UPI0003589B09|nr:carboxynorspermidine decarboxylase [Desulfovibrio sp. X2]EPR44699.1 carboxynorspermidine decarboxylase [Desulfovibrio sp. X2]